MTDTDERFRIRKKDQSEVNFQELIRNNINLYADKLDNMEKDDKNKWVREAKNFWIEAKYNRLNIIPYDDILKQWLKADAARHFKLYKQWDTLPNIKKYNDSYVFAYTCYVKSEKIKKGIRV